MSSDPTEYHHRPIESTQAVYRNPYETTYPYFGEVPPAPPPPPKQRHTWLIVVLMSIACLVLVLSGVFFGVTHSGASQKVAHVTPTVTPIPIPKDPPTVTPIPPLLTPVPTISYYARDIYNDFVVNGLGGADPKYDTNWKCCTYVPAGRAIVWTDSTSGYTLDIATFYNTADAEVDADDLFKQGFYSNVVHACLLSYDKTVPNSVLSRYLQLMQTYCN
jgi:hypothetical protein